MGTKIEVGKTYIDGEANIVKIECKLDSLNDIFNYIGVVNNENVCQYSVNGVCADHGNLRDLVKEKLNDYHFYRFICQNGYISNSYSSKEEFVSRIKVRNQSGIDGDIVVTILHSVLDGEYGKLLSAKILNKEEYEAFIQA